MSMGLPCAHQLREFYAANRPLQLGLIHRHRFYLPDSLPNPAIASFWPLLLNPSQGHQQGTSALASDHRAGNRLGESSEQDGAGSEAETDYSSWDGFTTDEEDSTGDNASDRNDTEKCVKL